MIHHSASSSSFPLSFFLRISFLSSHNFSVKCLWISYINWKALHKNYNVVKNAGCAPSRNTWRLTQIFFNEWNNQSSVPRTVHPPLKSIIFSHSNSIKIEEKKWFWLTSDEALRPSYNDQNLKILPLHNEQDWLDHLCLMGCMDSFLVQSSHLHSKQNLKSKDQKSVDLAS